MSNQPGHEDDPKDLNEDVDIEGLDPELATPDEIAALKKTAQTALAQKTHWKEKYNKSAVDPETGKTFKDLFSEGKNLSSKETTPEPKNEELSELKESMQRLEVAEQKRQFGYKRAYSPEETDIIYAYANGVGKKPEEVLEDTFVKKGIEALRQDARQALNTPHPSSRLSKISGKTVHELSEDERRKNWASITGAE